MAIFLLLYVLIMIVWLSWSGVMTYVLLKYRYPDNIGFVRLILYWVVCGVFLLLSIAFIIRADWVSIPPFMSALGV